MPEIEVTATAGAPEPTAEPTAPAPTVQVVALETAGATELAREQGKQQVTLEALVGIVAGQGSELAQHRATIAELRETARAHAQAMIELEPEPEPAVTEIDVAETSESAPTVESEVTTSERDQPRRERGPLMRIFLGRSV
jgi:hypothetical protein